MFNPSVIWRRRSRPASPRGRRRAGVALFLVALTLPFYTFNVLANGTTTLVSINREGKSGGNDFSIFPSISADGRFVAFTSVAGDLTAAELDRSYQVFVRDLQAGKTTLVSVNSAGTGRGNRGSGMPSISADGRFIAFMSHATDLTAGDTNGFIDVFVRDLQAGTTTLVSANSAGKNGGNGNSQEPSISAGGRFVAFMSNASDLTAGDSNGSGDIFVRDLQAGTATLVSVNSAGAGGGNGGSGFPSISADGRFVTFTSAASDLTDNDTNDMSDVFVRDLKSGKTTLVSVNNTGASGGNLDSSYSSVSADGRFVTFVSWADNLVGYPTAAFSDVYVRDTGSLPHE